MCEVRAWALRRWWYWRVWAVRARWLWRSSGESGSDSISAAVAVWTCGRVHSGFPPPQPLGLAGEEQVAHSSALGLRRCSFFAEPIFLSLRRRAFAARDGFDFLRVFGTTSEASTIARSFSKQSSLFRG